MSVETFENMTPSEFVAAVKGYYWKVERDAKDRAIAILSIINTCSLGKKKFKLKDLYNSANQDPINPFYRSLLGL